MSAAGRPWYPIFLDLSGRPVLIVGGGRLALEKVRGLQAAEADLTLIAPDLIDELRDLRDAGAIAHLARDYRDGDMAGCALVMAADDSGRDPGLNARLQREGRERGILVNAADDPSHCDFILPAVVRDGPLTLALSTGGGSPAIARRLREELSDYLSADDSDGTAGDLARIVADVRADLRRRGCFRAIPADDWQAAIDGRLRALIAQRRDGQAKALLLARLGAPLFAPPADDPFTQLQPCRAV